MLKFCSASCDSLISHTVWVILMKALVNDGSNDFRNKNKHFSKTTKQNNKANNFLYMDQRVISI